jgi:uncharacterized membrane protein YeaQ/YmgE (transglycosylase-associated protein family)
VLQLDILGWIVVGFLAGWISGVIVERGGPTGCLPNIAVGVLGGILGGWFAKEELHMGPVQGFVGALIVASLGAIVIRLLLDALEGDRRSGRRRW